MPVSVLTDVPEESIPQEVRDLIHMGSKKLEIAKQGDGLWTIRDLRVAAATRRARAAGRRTRAAGNFFLDVIRKDARFSSRSRIGDPALLEPKMRKAVESILADALTQGVRLMLFETFRSKARQAALFEQGATKLRTVGVHHYGLAADLVRDDDGSPSWKGDFSFLGELARKHGLIWGGDWGRPDLPHTFVDAVHVQRVALTRQHDLFAGTWYPGPSYDPYG